MGLAPIIIRGPDCIPNIKARAYRERCDELLGCAVLLPVILQETRLLLPCKAAFPDPPDVVFSMEQSKLAIEVSRVGWQRQSQVLGEANNTWPSSRVELNPSLWVDRKARPGQAGQRRSGDYAAIKLKGEPLDGPGSVDDEPLRATVDALQSTIDRKKTKLGKYTTDTSAVWLFLIDDGYPGVWAELLGRIDFKKEVETRCAGTGFERVYLYRFSETSPRRLA